MIDKRFLSLEELKEITIKNLGNFEKMLKTNGDQKLIDKAGFRWKTSNYLRSKVDALVEINNLILSLEVNSYIDENGERSSWEK